MTQPLWCQIVWYIMKRSLAFILQLYFADFLLIYQYYCHFYVLYRQDCEMQV